MNRVVVTGMGIISPIGNDIDTYWESLKNGVCGVDKIARFDASRLKVSLDAEVKDFNPKDHYETMQEIRKSDLFMQYAMAATNEAMEMSGLADSDIDKERLGVYIGTGIGGINTTIDTVKRNETKGPKFVSPFFIPMMIGNMAAGTVAIKYGAKGPTLPMMTACATSTNAIGEAYRAIKHGYADAIIAAIKQAINESGITGDEEIYVNAHGTSTHLNDAMETKALKTVFGEKAYDLHVSSTKSMTGHMLGAAGAAEAIASILALQNGVVPPTINYKEKDEGCDLDITPNVAVEADLEYAISTSLGFGGHNACVAMKRVNSE